MKKWTVFGLVCSLAMGATFISCGEAKTEESKKVMQVSCNPSVEFVLDEKDKVISVNALNEEGNLIVSGEVFLNLTAEEAAKLFVEASKEMGFIVETGVKGEVTIAENEITLSFLGDEATKLYNSVKDKVGEYLTAENITVTVTQGAAITEANLEALVAECAPYMEAAEIQALDYMELVETLYESRKETAEFYSQELKTAYYEAKAFAMEQAELEVVKGQLDIISKTIVEEVNKGYVSAINSLETLRKTCLVDENSPYQTALKSFREAKVAYLQYRAQVAAMELGAFTQEVQTQLKALDDAVASTEAALTKAGEQANQQISDAKALASSTYNAVIAAISDYSSKVNASLTDISKRQQTAKAEFFTNFETDYAAAIAAAKTNWSNMKTELEGGTQPQA